MPVLALCVGLLNTALLVLLAWDVTHLRGEMDRARWDACMDRYAGRPMRPNLLSINRPRVPPEGGGRDRA